MIVILLGMTLFKSVLVMEDSVAELRSEQVVWQKHLRTFRNDWEADQLIDCRSSGLIDL